MSGHTPERPEHSNPILSDSSRLPRFDEITSSDVEPGISALVEEVERALATLEEGPVPTWEGVVEPIERLHDRLGFGWGVVEHLLSVRNSDALREAYEKSEPAVVKLSMRIGQSPALYRALVTLREDGNASARLDRAQRRILAKLIQEAELAGVALSGETKERFQANKLEQAKLATKFGNQLLDATKAFALVLKTPDEIGGLPKSYLEMAAQAARGAGNEDASPEDGPWRITLDAPSFSGFMKHSTRRDLREKLYRAHVTRASDGELDNTRVLQALLKLRKEEAELLGFGSYAELSLSRKMAATVDRAERLLEELREASFDAARRELDELRTFMREQGALEADDLAHWDVGFWSERLREKRYDYNEEEIRQYFPLPRVLEGLFSLARKLFDVDVVPADGLEPVWHPDVRFFRVLSADGGWLASFYLDAYSRPREKRGGAWMNEVVGRSLLFAGSDGAARRPVAHLICNGSPPVDGKPSLMTFREIETLFHEFGHTLQHMLTTVDYGLASGIRNVEWDAVELPSQFMENWCYHRETLIGLSQHVDSGEPLPDTVFEKLRAARTFQAGLGMLRQLYYGFLDLELHHRYDAFGEETAADVQMRIAERATVLPPIEEDRFLCGFAHIFQGAYGAGYYSYKWAEVLSADAFSAFEEAGLDLDDSLVQVGRRFRDTILSLGGSVPPMEVFKQFRGREPSTKALLRHSGLFAA